MIFQCSDTKYKILNVQSSVGFNGWENMKIRYKILIPECKINIRFFNSSTYPSRYDQRDKMWKMTHARNADFFAFSRASEKSLLLGAHFWVVHNDSVECSDQGKTSYMTNLTLHACDTEYFACNNAYCIPMEKR